MRLLVIALMCCSISFPLNAQDEISLSLHTTGLIRPVSMAHSGDDRMFVVEKRGTIRILDTDGNILPEFFLDIRSRVDDNRSEEGLLGLVFHPQYADNGFFYVNYTSPGNTIVARYSVNPNDPNDALEESELILITQSQPYDNHNAGDIQFGPDGYLYIGMGDGGDGGDPQNRSQNLQTLLGKMLRIDVDNGPIYQIPADNPWVDDEDVLPEIWSYGLRNPWRFSFDRMTGDMYIADVGQNRWEEINFQAAGSYGGQNYGWRCYEANAVFNFSQCQDVTDLVFPIHAYNQEDQDECSVTGGYVYRGQNPDFQGRYLYCDFCSGQFWWLSRNATPEWQNVPAGRFKEFEYSCFGEDVNGELYVAALFEGRIYKIELPIVESTFNPIIDASRFLPNPTTGRTDMLIESGRLDNVRVFNVQGQSVDAVRNYSANSASIDLSNVANGVYVIRYSIDGIEYLERLVKQDK